MEGLVSPLDERMDQEHARVRQIYAAVRAATQGESIAGYLLGTAGDVAARFLGQVCDENVDGTLPKVLPVEEHRDDMAGQRRE